jgi:hypothetical protein
VDATITEADRAGVAGIPGDMAFEVHSLTVRGIQIPLKGGETIEGADRYKSRMFLIVPIAGLASLAIHGYDAEIKPGMTFTVAVAADTPLHP